MQTCAITKRQHRRPSRFVRRPAPGTKKLQRRKDLVTRERLQDSRCPHHAAKCRGQRCREHTGGDQQRPDRDIANHHVVADQLVGGACASEQESLATGRRPPSTPMASNVPRGIDFDGFAKSPDMFAPAMMPVTAGKKRANIVKRFSPSEYFDDKFACRYSGLKSAIAPA